MVDQTDFFAALQQCSTGEARQSAQELRQTVEGCRWAGGGHFLPLCSAFHPSLAGGLLVRSRVLFVPVGWGYALYSSGAALAQLKLTSDSMEHRLAGLLDQRWEADGFFLGKLSRIIKLAKAKGIAIDCALLLEDLLYWNSSTQSVQRKWAKAMYE